MVNVIRLCILTDYEYNPRKNVHIMYVVKHVLQSGIYVIF